MHARSEASWATGETGSVPRRYPGMACTNDRPANLASGVPVSVEISGVSPARTSLRPGESWLLGTHADCDLVLDGLGVSPRHCRLHHRGDFVELEDLGTTRGLRVGGARVRWAELPLSASFDIATTPVSVRPVGGAPRTLGMVGTSDAMRRLTDEITRVGATSLPVILRGESCTGKELAARAVHDTSARRDGPFVAVNGATISASLGLSQLFGHVRGAFTGANEPRPGAFREAHGGTLFIDELGSLPIEAQAALLRVLEDRTVIPVGADRGARVDVRLVCATCEPLEERVDAGAFRFDLYQRLSVCILHVPPLRQRREDIPALVSHLLRTSEVAGHSIEPDAIALLQRDPLPGNVRELRNVLMQAALRSERRSIAAVDVAAVLDLRRPPQRLVGASEAADLVSRHGGNISAAARRAGLPRSTFRDRLRAPSPYPALGLMATPSALRSAK